MKTKLSVIDPQLFTWPASRLGEAIDMLARKSGFAPKPGEALPLPSYESLVQGEALSRWIEAVASHLGLEAEPLEVSYAEVEQLVRNVGPALLQFPSEGEPRFLVLLDNQRRVSVLGPDLLVHKLRAEAICTALGQKLESSIAKEMDQLLDEARVPQRRRLRARKVIVRELLGAERIGGCWLVRLPPGANFWQHLRQARLWRYLATLASAHTAQYFLWLLAWWTVGQGILQGRLDEGWLVAWALLLLTLVPFQLLATWVQGRIAIGIGGLLKQRLLYGALRLEPEEIRHQGVGQLLGRVIEAEAVESLALSGGLLALVSGIELIMAMFVLGAGAGGWLHVLLFCSWGAFTGLLGWRYFQRRRAWTTARLEMTHDLTERMVGHRTRLAQEAREHWHDGEDQALARYLELSGALDRSGTLLLALIPRGWLVLGLIGLAPAFISGQASPAQLAVGLGGLLLAFRALQSLAGSLSHLAGAAIAWTQVAPLFHAAARSEILGTPDLALAVEPQRAQSSDKHVVMEAHDLVFRYRDRGEPVLKGVTLRVCSGDRLLLEGPSGGGKSTLASLLIGLRLPESGLLLLDGLDRQTLGAAGWRQRVVAAPQFHENHVLTGTFAFNLLMGRRWPPQPTDVEEAEALCRTLGLGDVLDRMPAGLLQMVGETGWQLSHGEKSRLYIARALLQNAELVVLDESFAALDPENLQRALRCVLDRASTVLVIAHP